MSLKSIGQMSRTGGLLFVLLSSGAGGTPASAQTLTTLVSFDNANGSHPSVGLIADAHGNLFGTTFFGGEYGAGTAFEIVKTKRGYASTPTTLVNFDNANGSSPFSGLIADAHDNLFGTTEEGGAYGWGTAFEIVKTSRGYASTPTTLVSFEYTYGSLPYAGLIADADGNLFGTTGFGGAYGYGTTFEIVKTSSGYAGTPTTLVNFDNANGSSPYAGLIADADGNLFGTTSGGGAYGYGTVFEIVKTKRGYASTPTTLVSFDNAHGSYPTAGLIADAQGNLFGTTYEGGASDLGTVFEVTGSGFVPPRQFAGTPGSADCFGKSISTLARTYGGIADAASALGYASVTALRSAVASYCSN